MAPKMPVTDNTIRHFVCRLFTCYH